MKTPRVKDFDPNAKLPTLKSPLENMPVINNTAKPHHSQLDTVSDPKRTETKRISENEHHSDNDPGVPPPVPRTVPRSDPLIPKVKRVMRQRQTFDIYEDQYQSLKKIADKEKEYINGRGMSQMVRIAIDNYLKEHGTSKE